MTTLIPRREAEHASQTNDLLDLSAVRHAVGGTRPLHSATIYRLIKRGLLPAPIHVGPNTSRWLRSEIEAALQVMIARRASQ
jgi:predicted DNA-binding transcriptional regulator AlpA